MKVVHVDPNSDDAKEARRLARDLIVSFFDAATGSGIGASYDMAYTEMVRFVFGDVEDTDEHKRTAMAFDANLRWCFTMVAAAVEVAKMAGRPVPIMNVVRIVAQAEHPELSGG